MKTTVYLVFAIVLIGLASCNSSEKTEKQAEENPDPFDTLYLKDGESLLHIDRWRTIKNLSQSLRLGKMNINLNLNDVSTSISTDIIPDSGIIIYNDKVFEVFCFINTEKIKILGTDSNQKITTATPEYLLNAKDNYLRFEFKGNFYPQGQPLAATCTMDKGDTAGVVTDAEITIKNKKSIVNEINARMILDGVKWKLYSSQLKGEVVKDSIRARLTLQFGK